MDEAAATVLPSLALALSQQLDCAALAMRYPVGDAFAATDLLLAALREAAGAAPAPARRPAPGPGRGLADDLAMPPLSPVTPILVGPRAADLQLVPPRAAAAGVRPAGGRAGPRFSARAPALRGPPVQPMLRASQALARRSARGAACCSTACPVGARPPVPWSWPTATSRPASRATSGTRRPRRAATMGGDLAHLMQDFQSQLNAPELGLTTALDDPAHFRRFTLPRLRALLQERSLLLVLDNLETLLTDSYGWRDPLWGEAWRHCWPTTARRASRAHPPASGASRPGRPPAPAGRGHPRPELRRERAAGARPAPPRAPVR